MLPEPQRGSVPSHLRRSLLSSILRQAFRRLLSGKCPIRSRTSHSCATACISHAIACSCVSPPLSVLMLDVFRLIALCFRQDVHRCIPLHFIKELSDPKGLVRREVFLYGVQGRFDGSRTKTPLLRCHRHGHVLQICINVIRPASYENLNHSSTNGKISEGRCMAVRSGGRISFSCAIGRRFYRAL